MNTIKTFLETLSNSPHYSYGWLVLAALAILPAIVSGNLIQVDLSKLFKYKFKQAHTIKSLLLNISILLVCICIFAYAFYLYIWT